MLNDDVAAALCAITAFADVAALESAEEFLAFGDTDIFLLPQSECADRRGRIAPAIFAVAVTHLQGFAPRLDLYHSAVTSACMRFGHERDTNQASRNLGSRKQEGRRFIFSSNLNNQDIQEYFESGNQELRKKELMPSRGQNRRRV